MLWWETLSLASRVFMCVAVPTTVLLLIQTVLMLIGMDGDFHDGTDVGHGDFVGGPDADGTFDIGDAHDGVFESDVSVAADAAGFEALRIFTVRGIIAFFVVFGWVGYAMDRAAISLFITIPVAFAAGAAMMLVLALLLRAVMKLRSGGNIDNRNAVGTAGTVYLAVPPKRSGIGKVNVLLQGSYVERDAVTDETESIPTGAEVLIIGLSGQTTLVVKRK